MELTRAFHERHELLFGYTRELPIELVHWRLVARGRTTTARSETGSAMAEPEHGEWRASPSEQRLVHLSELGGWILTDIYPADDLQPGMQVDGPAIIRASATTVLLSAGDRALVRSDGSYLLQVGIQQGASAAATGHMPSAGDG